MTYSSRCKRGGLKAQETGKCGLLHADGVQASVAFEQGGVHLNARLIHKKGGV